MYQGRRLASHDQVSSGTEEPLEVALPNLDLKEVGQAAVRIRPCGLEAVPPEVRIHSGGEMAVVQAAQHIVAGRAVVLWEERTVVDEMEEVPLEEHNRPFGETAEGQREEHSFAGLMMMMRLAHKDSTKDSSRPLDAVLAAAAAAGSAAEPVSVPVHGPFRSCLRNTLLLSTA